MGGFAGMLPPLCMGVAASAALPPKGGENLFAAATAYSLRVLALPRKGGGDIEPDGLFGF